MSTRHSLKSKGSCGRVMVGATRESELGSPPFASAQRMSHTLFGGKQILLTAIDTIIVGEPHRGLPRAAAVGRPYDAFRTSGLTTFSGLLPLSTATILPAAISAIFVRVSSEALPMWGSNTTLSSLTSPAASFGSFS